MINVVVTLYGWVIEWGLNQLKNQKLYLYVSVWESIK